MTMVVAKRVKQVSLKDSLDSNMFFLWIYTHLHSCKVNISGGIQKKTLKIEGDRGGHEKVVGMGNF